MTLQISTGFVVGLVIGGVVGFVMGYLLGIISNLKKSKETAKESQAQKRFNSAMQEEDSKRKLKLMAQIVDKYPGSEWSDKALDQVMKLRKESESRSPEAKIDINQELE